ncbi:hypothetical protein KY499_00235 [Arthrobacter sp. PAMC25284]|nr:hypothetical protein KY499_00235 [Arthrobacter sp. PAMC25284]
MILEQFLPLRGGQEAWYLCAPSPLRTPERARDIQCLARVRAFYGELQGVVAGTARNRRQFPSLPAGSC